MRTSVKLLRKYKDNPFLQLLINLIPSFGSALDRALTTISDNLEISENFEDIKTASEYLQTIDQKLLNTIRDLNFMNNKEKVEIYRDIIKANLIERNIYNEKSILSFLNTFASEISNNIHKDIYLKINIQSNLETISFSVNEQDLLIEKPSLLWDCHCPKPFGIIPENEVSKYANSQNCPIHSKVSGIEVTNAFRNHVTLFQYEDIKVIWKQSPEYWPPSIDTFLMCQNLKNENVLHDDILNILDIGSGTGFLGLYIGLKNPNIQKVYLADWLFTPLLYSMISWELNTAGNNYKQVIPLLGINSSWLPSPNIPKKFDICICNPPYLPKLEKFPAIMMSNTVAGTDLLAHVIKDISEVSKITYLNLSAIAMPEAIQFANEKNRKLVRIGNSMLVPFRVPHAYNCPGYIEKLLEDDRIIINSKSRYKYWHKISTYKIE